VNETETETGDRDWPRTLPELGWLENVYLPPEERRQKEQLLAELEHQLAAAGDSEERGEYYWNI
jgi:hypothetical protein